MPDDEDGRNVLTDEYGEILNGADTYEDIALALQRTGSAVIGWTDEHSTHLDILFTLFPFKEGNLQRGLHGKTDLFVGIMGVGCHGFTISQYTDGGYVAEKFGRNPNVTWECVAELLNGVRAKLNEMADQ